MSTSRRARSASWRVRAASTPAALRFELADVACGKPRLGQLVDALQQQRTSRREPLATWPARGRRRRSSWTPPDRDRPGGALGRHVHGERAAATRRGRSHSASIGHEEWLRAASARPERGATAPGCGAGPLPADRPSEPEIAQAHLKIRIVPERDRDGFFPRQPIGDATPVGSRWCRVARLRAPSRRCAARRSFSRRAAGRPTRATRRPTRIAP